MENTDSYPVFHTLLAATAGCRRPTGADHAAGYLVLNAAERLVEVFAAEVGDLAVHDGERPAIPRQLRRTPGAHCPVPGCTHRHDPDDPPCAAIRP